MEMCKKEIFVKFTGWRGHQPDQMGKPAGI